MTTPSHIVVKRFQEAPDDFTFLTQSRQYPQFLQDFERTLTSELERLQKLVSCQMVTVVECDKDPYECYEDLHRDVLLRGRLHMKRFDKYKLPVPSHLYSMMRTIHDLHHVLLNLPFDYESEYLACDLMIRALTRHKPCELVAAFIRSDIIYNVACTVEGVDSGSKLVLENLLYD